MRLLTLIVMLAMCVLIAAPCLADYYVQDDGATENHTNPQGYGYSVLVQQTGDPTNPWFYDYNLENWSTSYYITFWTWYYNGQSGSVMPSGHANSSFGYEMDDGSLLAHMAQRPCVPSPTSVIPISISKKRASTTLKAHSTALL